MKIQDLSANDSSFIELDLNEAADVCGGYDGWSPRLSDDLFHSSLGYDSISAYYMSQNRNRFTPEATLANGINSNSLAAFNRRVAGIMSFTQYM